MSRRLMLRNASGGGVLPSEYQRVEWIGTRTNAYINTGIYVMDGTITEIEFTTDIFGLSNKSYVMMHFGSYYGQFIGKIADSNKFGLTPSTIFSFSAGYYQQKRLLKIRWSELNTNAEIGGEVIQHSRTSPANHDTLILGSKLNSSAITTLNTNIYSCVNRGNNIEQILIPCYRKSDHVIGLYDLVSKSFFTNAGTGTFTKGADVN